MHFSIATLALISDAVRHPYILSSSRRTNFHFTSHVVPSVTRYISLPLRPFPFSSSRLRMSERAPVFHHSLSRLSYFDVGRLDAHLSSSFSRYLRRYRSLPAASLYLFDPRSNLMSHCLVFSFFLSTFFAISYIPRQIECASIKKVSRAHIPLVRGIESELSDKNKETSNFIQALLDPTFIRFLWRNELLCLHSHPNVITFRIISLSE